MWQNQHPETTKWELEEQWRRTHKAVAKQLAPCLADTHNNPRFPLASTFNFLDTLHALNVPVSSFLSTSACMSISCALPDFHIRNSAAEAGSALPRAAAAQKGHSELTNSMSEGGGAAHGVLAYAVPGSSATVDRDDPAPAAQQGVCCSLCSSDCFHASASIKHHYQLI